MINVFFDVGECIEVFFCNVIGRRPYPSDFATSRFDFGGGDGVSLLHGTFFGC